MISILDLEEWSVLYNRRVRIEHIRHKRRLVPSMKFSREKRGLVKVKLSNSLRDLERIDARLAG